MMKKLISLVVLISAFSLFGQAARIITSFDIARWYLDADLVMICNVTQTEIFTLGKHDTLVADGFHVRYDIVREKYKLSIDSVIKGGELINGAMDTIFTPDFISNYSKTREWKEFTGLDSKGDSVFINYFEMYGDNYNDDGYFRIESTKKHLVILRKTDVGYVIDYETECDSLILGFIKDVEVRGEDYFTFLFNQSVKTKDLQIYPNPFTDIIHINGIQAKRIKITDICGNIIRAELQNQNSIDLSALEPGIYFISVFTDTDRWTEKLVKK